MDKEKFFLDELKKKTVDNKDLSWKVKNLDSEIKNLKNDNE